MFGPIEKPNGPSGVPDIRTGFKQLTTDSDSAYLGNSIRYIDNAHSVLYIS